MGQENVIQILSWFAITVIVVVPLLAGLLYFHLKK
jgi:hypothetical protein